MHLLYTSVDSFIDVSNKCDGKYNEDKTYSIIIHLHHKQMDIVILYVTNILYDDFYINASIR